MVSFNVNLRDSQSTVISPIAPEKFDLEEYSDYEEALRERNEKFTRQDHGLLVYRRVRADGVFFDACRDPALSLSLQLGALKYSMDFKADIPNFLEPWYGIGYVCSSFGGDYIWTPNQAPATKPLFESCQEVLDADFKPIEQTPIGKKNLEMIEYFLDKTKGKLPVSFSDLQAPINMLSYVMSVTDLLCEVIDDPESVQKAANLMADLLIDFMNVQKNLIGDALARPGHGFASSRSFTGAGLSDDNSIMLSPFAYQNLFQPADEKIGHAFDGTVFHTCGNWANKIEMVQKFKGITTVDGAFSPETDPSPNDPSIFGEKFAGTGIVLNARAVGDEDTAFDVFSRMWRPDLKMIAVTYCQTPEEQEKLYTQLHRMAEERG